MKITYIGHSGFSVELPTATLLFDYYQNDIPDFPKDKPLYVFASHFHKDHFNPEVFTLASQYAQVTYILSHDIWMSRKRYIRAGIEESCFEQAIIMRARETKEFPDLTVTTLRSTDMGVSYLVRCDGQTIYHAGDLNWWLWDGATKEEAGNMTANYKREIDTLAGQPIDVAFVPLDPRLEENYALGLNYLLQTTAIHHVFPMHLWKKYETTKRYLSEYPVAESSKYYTVEGPGQSWEIE